MHCSQIYTLLGLLIEFFQSFAPPDRCWTRTRTRWRAVDTVRLRLQFICHSWKFAWDLVPVSQSYSVNINLAIRKSQLQWHRVNSSSRQIFNESNLCRSVGRTRPGWYQLKGTGSPWKSWRRPSIQFLPCLDRSSWTLGSLRSANITLNSLLALYYKLYHEVNFDFNGRLTIGFHWMFLHKRITYEDAFERWTVSMPVFM